MKEKLLFLKGFITNQLLTSNRIFEEIADINLENYDKKYVFSLKIQQLFTCLEDVFKNIAKVFENSIDDYSSFHKELLIRMKTEVPEIRPNVINSDSFYLLDKLRSFRHFIRHGYDYDLKYDDLFFLQTQLKKYYPVVINDINLFLEFIDSLIKGIGNY
ncbi:MAG: hypothetical protein WC002_03120 [Candidatus Muiribacteriota bacterium]